MIICQKNCNYSFNIQQKGREGAYYCRRPRPLAGAICLLVQQMLLQHTAPDEQFL